MRTYRQYIVNAFAEDCCKGNPAAVCIIDHRIAEEDGGLSKDEMQKIAFDNNLSETAFCRCIFYDEKNPRFAIRWFTPACEVPLCGHATLATSFVLFTKYFTKAQSLHFESTSGELTAHREGCLSAAEFYEDCFDGVEDYIIQMDFPHYDLEPVKETAEREEVMRAIGFVENPRIMIFKGIDYVAVFEKGEDVVEFKPDFKQIAAIPGERNLLITAPYETASGEVKVDFVSRCFFPKEGIDEDPVTGSAHCTLAPYWAERMGKSTLTAYQASSFGGILHLKVLPFRVIVGGRCKNVG